MYIDHMPYKISQPCSHGNSVNNVYVMQRVTLVRVLEGRWICSMKTITGLNDVPLMHVTSSVVYWH